MSRKRPSQFERSRIDQTIATLTRRVELLERRVLPPKPKPKDKSSESRAR